LSYKLGIVIALALTSAVFTGCGEKTDYSDTNSPAASSQGTNQKPIMAGTRSSHTMAPPPIAKQPGTPQ